MSEAANRFWEKYHQAPIIGIIRGLDGEDVYRVAESYCRSGLTTLEVTMNTKGVSGIISGVRKRFPELNVGAGTVCTMDDFMIAKSAGAQFVVTPVVVSEVVLTAQKESMASFVGAFTPTEIYQAWSLGASAVKVFPATQLGPKYIKDVLAPLDDIKLVPTGGVSRDNIKDFFAAGAFGVGMGSSLLDKKLIALHDSKRLVAHFKDVLSQLAGFGVS